VTACSWTPNGLAPPSTGFDAHDDGSLSAEADAEFRVRTSDFRAAVRLHSVLPVSKRFT
jgi:hypothetical protein